MMGRRAQVSKPERSSTHSRLLGEQPRGSGSGSAGALDRHRTSRRVFEAALVLQAPTIRVKLIRRRLRFSQSKIAAGPAALKPNKVVICSAATQQEANKRANSHQARAGRPCHGTAMTFGGWAELPLLRCSLPGSGQDHRRLQTVCDASWVLSVLQGASQRWERTRRLQPGDKGDGSASPNDRTSRGG